MRGEELITYYTLQYNKFSPFLLFRFKWRRLLLSESESLVEWTLPPDQEPGTYRIRHQGYRRKLRATATTTATIPYSGICNEFEVVSPGGTARRKPDGGSSRRGRKLGLLGRLFSKLFRIPYWTTRRWRERLSATPH